MPETIVKLESFAAVLGISVDTFRRRQALGKIPQADLNPNKRGASWRLSTIERWNPHVARRCLALQRALERYPLAAA